MDFATFKWLGEALAIGLLVGSERYRDREEGEKKSAGVRTFAIFALLGAVCGLLTQPAFTTITFAALAGLVLLGYQRNPAESLGFTTEFAALLVFWIGYLLHTHEAPAIALGIVLTIFLASKKALHEFVRDKISMAEFYATLKFLAVVLVIYPVLPDRDFGPFGFLNPQEIWGLVILVSTINYLGYILIRSLGAQRGLRVGAIMGGLVSTTATTMSLADRARRTPGFSRLLGVNAVIANSLQGPRLLVLIWIASQSLGQSLTVPLLGMGLGSLLVFWLVARKTDTDTGIEFSFDNPYSLSPALKFGVLFLVILFLIHAANTWFGTVGVLFAAGLAGLGSASAAALSIAGLVSAGELELSTAGPAVFLVIAVNSSVKWVICLAIGKRDMALWFGAGLVCMLTAGYLLLQLSIDFFG